MTQFTHAPDTITLVYAYYENGGMLDRHLQEWSDYRLKGKFRAIIVDDGSSKDSAIDHLDGIDVGFPIELYRINEDIPWNQDGARNLGMTHTDGWCMITDMDHLLNVKNAKKLATREYDSESFYTFRRELQDGSKYHNHPNSYFLTRDMYWKAGGYDESFRGFYGSDSVFQHQLESITNPHRLPISLTLFSREDIPDASTTIYGRKDTEYHISRNPELLWRRKVKPGPIPPLNFEWERLL